VGLARANDHAAEAVCDSVGTDWLVALVAVLAAPRALFFDVVDLAIRRQLVVPA